MTSKIKPCPHRKCIHFAGMHVGGTNSCTARGCLCPNYATTNQRDDRERCPRCEAYAHEASGHTNAICRLKGIGYFDATKAAALARRLRRSAVEISARQMRGFVSERSVYMPHCLHVNTRLYVVVGTYLEPLARGQLPHRPASRGDERHFMLDGSHRAFIRSRLGRATMSYVLTLDETMSVYLGKRAPSGKVFASE